MKKWDLTVLYDGFDSEEFQEDLLKIEQQIDFLIEYANNSFNDVEDSLKKLKTYLNLSETLRKKLYRAHVYCMLRLSTDATNEKAKRYMNKMQQFGAKTTLPSTKFSKWVPTIPNIDELLENDEELQELSFYVKRIVDGAQYVLSDDVEQVISKLQQTSSSAWGQLQGELTSTLKVDMDGKEMTLSEVRNLSSDPSQAKRKKAYEAEMNAYPKIAPSIAYAISGVKGEVNELTALRGFESPLSQAVYQSRMDEKTLNVLIDAMKEYLPHFHKYLKRKAKLLGHDGPLPYYDIFAPLGETSKEFTEEEAMEYIFKNFKTFSFDLEALARRAYEEEWIDFTPRDKKRGGAFCANIHPIKQSRILTNFTGSFSNVITLAHELGHAYHGEKIFKERMLNSSYTMPVAETASTFCETIVKNAALEDAEDQEKLFILEQSLKGSTQVIVDILSRFIFESNVFEKRKETPLNERMLNEMMMDAQKEAYGDSLDEEFMMPYAWLNKSHYYRGSLSFYNFPYAYGLLFAKGIYAEFQKRGESFTKQIDLLLRKTGQMTVEDVAGIVGLDVRSKDFWRQSLDVIVDEIDMFLELTK